MNPKSFSAEILSPKPGGPDYSSMDEVVLPKVQDFALPLVELHELCYAKKKKKRILALPSFSIKMVPICPKDS